MTVKSPFWPLSPLTPGNPENPCKPVSKSFSNSPQEAGPARVRVRPEEHTCSPLCPVCPGDPVSPLGPGAPGAPEVPRIPRSPSGPGRPLILTGGPQEQSPWLPATNRSTTVMHGVISQQTFAAGRQENSPLSGLGQGRIWSTNTLLSSQMHSERWTRRRNGHRRGYRNSPTNNHTIPVWQLPVSSAWGTPANTPQSITGSAETATSPPHPEEEVC